MVLEGLGKSLRNALDRIKGATSIDEQLIKDVVKDLQRALLQYGKPENAPLVREALIAAHREDLIGTGKDCLVRPENTFKGQGKNQGRNQNQRNQNNSRPQKNSKSTKPAQNGQRNNKNNKKKR